MRCFRYGDITRFTNTTAQATDVDHTPRRHAIIETVFADLIDGPMAHMPSGKSGGERRVGALRVDRPQSAACHRYSCR